LIVFFYILQGIQSGNFLPQSVNNKKNGYFKKYLKPRKSLKNNATQGRDRTDTVIIFENSWGIKSNKFNKLKLRNLFYSPIHPHSFAPVGHIWVTTWDNLYA